MYIIGIDPGTNETGIAVLHIDDRISVDHIRTACIRPDMDTTNHHTDRSIDIVDRVISVIDHYRPRHVTLETPFFYHKRPTAFGPLSELVGMLKYSCLSKYPEISFHTLSPSEIKQVFGPSDASKSTIQTSLSRIKEIGRWITPSMTDHETDAIAIAYITWLMVKNCFWI